MRDESRTTRDEPLRGRDEWVRRTLSSLTVAEKVGQLIVAYVSGSRPDTTHPENLRRFGVATPAEAVRKLHLGGVIYFAWSDNVDEPVQIAELSRGLQQASDVPLIVSIDQETGSVARIATALTQFPGAMALGATRDPANTRDVYEIVGRELAALGINTDYAPVGDVNVDPANPVIGVRSFSSDPELVATHVAAAVSGLRLGGVLSSAKHFPGHGDTAADSHVSLPVITHSRAEWERIDAPPFRAAIEAGCNTIMTGHLAFPALDPSGAPATLSKQITTALLREELGFDGVVVTDSLRMAGVRDHYSDSEAAVLALEAGADVLLDPELPLVTFQAVLDALASGRLSQGRLDLSVERVLRLKFDLRNQTSTVGDPSSGADALGSVLMSDDHLRRAQEITDQSTTLLRDDAGLVPLLPGSALVTGWGDQAVTWLADRLARKERPTTAFVTGDRPDPGTIAAAVESAGRHDVVVVTTSAAWHDPGQQDLLAALVGTGTPVVAVAVHDPYDVAAVAGVTTWAATYSHTTVALESLARMLEGTISPRGRLPVDIPTLTGPAETLYPFGTGLPSHPAVVVDV